MAHKNYGGPGWEKSISQAVLFLLDQVDDKKVGELGDTAVLRTVAAEPDPDPNAGQYLDRGSLRRPEPNPAGTTVPVENAPEGD